MTAVPEDQGAEAMASVLREDLAARPERPEHAVPCIPRGMRLRAQRRVHVPALASVPEWPDAPASPLVPAERPDSCRLQAKRRARSVPAPMRAAAVSNIQGPKKAQ